MLFVKRRRILVTYSRRLENSAGLRLSPYLSFFGSWNCSDANEGWGGRPPPSRAAWEAGRPAAGRPVPRDLSAICFPLFFADYPLPPGSGAARVYFCKFPYRKYIFVKNENKK